MSADQHPKLDVAAVVVTFNPVVASLERLLRLLKEQTRHLIVVDNASRSDIFKQLDKALLAGTSLIGNQTNLGIAAAQNIGIRKALSLGSAAVLFVDQDSQLDPGMIGILRGHLEQGETLLAAPVCFDREQGFGYPIVDIAPNGGRQKFYPDQLRQPVTVSVAISSGLLVHSKVFESVGLMDERLFIDYVDTEWCLRCAKSGFGVIVDPDARMKHSIGSKALSIGPFRVPVHDPARRYYRVRNAFLLLRYPHIPKRMALREVFFGFLHTFLLAISQRGRRRCVLYYLRGVIDGIRGRTGMSFRSGTF